MEILIQKDVSEPSTKAVFAKISTEVLTLEDIVCSLSDIIDEKKLGYHRLPFVDAKSESLQRLDVYTSLRRRRADRAYLLSNGRNTIYLLDYVVKAKNVHHDPVVCIIGPDAEKIAQIVTERLSRILLSKTYQIKFNEETIKDFSNLMGYEKAKVVKQLSEIFEEAELTVRMKLLKGRTDKLRFPPVDNGLSKEIIQDMKNKSFSVKEFNSGNIVPFGIIAALIMILLIVLTRF